MLAMLFRNIPFEPRELKATEAHLEAIYRAAHAGLKGDAMAFAAGMLPCELRRLQQFDAMAEMAELKGRADSEMEAAGVINEAIAAGDAKMALEKLRFQHQWVAKQQIEVNVEGQISVIAALERAEKRVILGAYTEVEDAVTSPDLLTDQHKGHADGCSTDNPNPSEKSTTL